MLCSFEVLHSIRAMFAAEPVVSRGRFQSFVKAALDRQSELRALGWAPRVADARRGQFTSKAQGVGLSGL